MKAIAMLFSLALTTTAQNIPADPDTIAGIVTSAKGPEAGVWGIAETTGLPTKFAKIVVTDDRGRYLLPDLPKATYSIRVRGYGLVDSPKVQSPRGTTLNLKVTLAPDARAAAEYYPASFWYSLLRVPDKSEFPGTGPQGNGILPNMKSQAEFLELIKTDSCWSCHQRQGSEIESAFVPVTGYRFARRWRAFSNSVCGPQRTGQKRTNRTHRVIWSEIPAALA
jgi:hypothetical protein